MIELHFPSVYHRKGIIYVDTFYTTQKVTFNCISSIVAVLAGLGILAT